jgi:glycosyltransferase involved in cell wall biosynthesis
VRGVGVKTEAGSVVRNASGALPKPTDRGRVRVCFVAGAVYKFPLDSTTEKKFRELSVLGELVVVAFAQSWRPRVLKGNATFILLPRPWPSATKYPVLVAVGTLTTVSVLLRRGPTVIVAQSPYDGVPAALAKMIGRLLGRQVALVVESHGDFRESLFLERRLWFPSVWRRLMHWASYFAFWQADALRAVSSFTRRQLESCARGQPIVEFPAWTDFDEFWQAAPAGSRDVVLFAGVITRLKGVDYLIEAFAKVASEFPAIRLALVGRRPDAAYLTELQRRTEELGISSRVDFIPEVVQSELASWMTRAIVFVLPSLSEGLGRVVFEAMATTTPVIATAVGGIPELIEDGSTGFLVPPRDHGALADRIRWMLQHPAEAQCMGERARRAAESLFSTSAYVAGYAAIVADASKRLNGVPRC